MAVSSAFLFVAAFAVLWFAGPSHAFGAGNIISVSTVEGTNWRHGDIEETLLQLVMIVGKSEKFDDLAVKRVYFGNWLRDYSQAIDVGGLKQLPADTLRILIWVLSFMTFGYATQEFEVTAERLGTYRPEEHIDNPKDYADNEDARKYDQRLRGPVDEGKELAIDPKRGLKNYIMNESIGITTSAALVRDRFIKAINLGREYTKGGDKNKLYEALRNLGTGLHCMEDYSAHSNFVELTLRELGEKDIFPIVGDKTEVDIEGKKIYPLVTGTFGMTDFLHSVVGEVSDKVAQSEITQLESKLDDSTNKSKETGGSQSYLQKILDMVPFGLLGDYSGTAEELQKNADAKQMENAKLTDGPSGKMVIGGYDTDELKKQAEETLKNMYPILEFHDNIMKTISQAVDSVPGLSSMLDDLTGAIQIFVFSLLSPYLKPILAQCKSELQAGSGGVLETSEKAQFNVFEDDKCSDPTHSMLSKDHFSHVLNTIAGQVAAETLKFAVNAITEAWGDDSKDPRKVTDWILQCFFHPALKKENCPGQQVMLDTVKNWWEKKDDSEKEELRQALSKQGVKDGKNHVGDGADDHGANHHAKPRMQKADQEETQQRSTERSKPRREEEQGGGRSGGYGQDTETSSGGYGGGRSGGYGQDTETTSGIGGRSGGGYGGDQESSSGYGRTEESSGYGRSEETSGYGRSEETSGYGRSEETSGYGRGSQREEESSYGGRQESSGYGQDTERETTTQYTGRRTLAERIDDPTGDGPGTSSYDRDNTSSMPGGYDNTESSSGYGRNESSGYGESRETEDTYGSSGRRRGGDDEQEGYSRESRY